jgi:ElaB/YqjD/DUF883 family membrane-anchored ribosome-binding protein
MARADEIRALAQEIAASYDERMAVLASIRKEVSELADSAHAMLNDFHKEHSEMASNLRKNLSKERAFLNREVCDQLSSFRKEHEDAIAAWGNLVSTMRSKRGGVRPQMARV